MLLYRFNEIDEVARSIAAEMNRTGHAMLKDFITPAELRKMQDFVTQAVERSEGAYAGFTTVEAVAGSGLDELGASEPFRELVERIFEAGTGLEPTQEAFYQVLRCLTGKSAAQHSLLFHYDSYVVTVLIPVIVPTKGRTGDFILLPNTRPIRSSYARNVVDKLLLDNKLTQVIFRGLHSIGMLPITRLKLQPGNAYFFWGYRSVHTNEACDDGSVRATALFHYVNPHLGRSRRPRAH